MEEKKEEKPWMEMGGLESLSHDDWMWENTGLAEAIMEGRARKPVRDIIEKYVKDNWTPISTEKLDDGSLKIHWLDDEEGEDYEGVVLKPEDFPLFEEAACRKLKAVIAEYAETHGYGDEE